MTPQEILKNEGFKHIFEWHDTPGTVYKEHSHQDKVTMFITNEDLYFMYNNELEIHLKIGDRFDVIPNKKHTARVGENGCRYIVGEMIQGDS